MRLALPLTIATLLLGLLAGCGGGSSSGETGTGTSGGGATTQGSPEGPPGASAEDCGTSSLRVSGSVSCEQGEGVLADWSAAPGCKVIAGNSHASCKVRGYLCIAAVVQRGTAVACAQPSESIFFIEPR